MHCINTELSQQYKSLTFHQKQFTAEALISPQHFSESLYCKSNSYCLFPCNESSYQNTHIEPSFWTSRLKMLTE